MKPTSQVVAPPRRKYAGAGNSFLPKCTKVNLSAHDHALITVACRVHDTIRRPAFQKGPMLKFKRDH
jgi:hypothetical protein